MGSTTCLTVRVQPAPEQAQAWLAQHDIDPGSPVLQNLMPELCDRCGQEASHFRPAEVLCTGCLPGNPRPFVELFAMTPPPCRECDEEATRYRRPHTSCENCRQEDHDNYRSLVNSQETVSTASTSAPPPNSAISKRTTGRSATTLARECPSTRPSKRWNATGQPASWPNWHDQPETQRHRFESPTDDRTFHPIDDLELPDGDETQNIRC